LLENLSVPYFFTCRIKEFSEWAQCLVLELVSKYIPADSSEIFDMMNLLEDRLQHANGAVVLATVKLFLQLTLSMADVHQQVRIDFCMSVCQNISFNLLVFHNDIFLYMLFFSDNSLV